MINSAFCQTYCSDGSGKSPQTHLYTCPNNPKGPNYWGDSIGGLSRTTYSTANVKGTNSLTLKEMEKTFKRAKKELSMTYGAGTGAEMLGLKANVDDEDGGTYYGSLGHVWKGTYPELGTGKEGKYRHMCLRMGYWCWGNLATNPLDLIQYVRIRLTLNKKRWYGKLRKEV